MQQPTIYDRAYVEKKVYNLATIFQALNIGKKSFVTIFQVTDTQGYIIIGRHAFYEIRDMEFPDKSVPNDLDPNLTRPSSPEL